MSITGTKCQFTDNNISLVPDAAGVYGLLEGDLLIYYGSSETSIKSRLQRHKDGKEGRCTQAATHLTYELTSEPDARETDLLEAHKRVYGKLPRCNDVLT